MSRLGRKILTLALFLPAGPALANGAEPVQKTGLESPAWKPNWKPMKAPSENTHLVGTSAQRIFSPMAAVRITNHLRDEGSAAKEILVAGHETSDRQANVVTIKLYQESTDRYTRVNIPPDLLSELVETHAGTHREPITHQGVGTSGKKIVVAGGSFEASGHGPARGVFMIDGQTKKVKKLPDLKTPRSLPMVGSSPNGRYVIVAGGVTYDLRSSNNMSNASTAIDVIDRVTGQHVDLAAKFPGLAKGLPNGRFAGSIAWVQEPGVNRIFFIGGSSATFTTRFQPRSGPLAQQPMKQIDFYDVNTDSWGSLELPTPRMGAAVAIRQMGHGKTEIVVAGGGTGTTASQPVDPQIYAVERIDPKSLTVKFGENVPEQRGVYTRKTDRDEAVATEWTPNAMVLTNGRHDRVEVDADGAKRHPDKADRWTKGARFFGFSRAFKTDPVPASERPAPATVVNNTTINNTRIEETNVHNDVEVDVNTKIENTEINNDVNVTNVKVKEEKKKAVFGIFAK